jgi:type II restriction enzyme
MPTMVKRDRIILYKHTCNYELIKAVALDVKNHCKTDVSDVERSRMAGRLAALNQFKTRNPKDKPLDSINHRINTLEYWMFGYEYKEV